MSLLFSCYLFSSKLMARGHGPLRSQAKHSVIFMCNFRYLFLFLLTDNTLVAAETASLPGIQSLLDGMVRIV